MRPETNWITDLLGIALFRFLHAVQHHTIAVLASILVPIIALVMTTNEVNHKAATNQTIDLVAHIQAAGGVAIQLDDEERVKSVLGNRMLISRPEIGAVVEGMPIDSVIRLDSTSTRGSKSYRTLFQTANHRYGTVQDTDARVHVSSFTASGSSWLIVYPTQGADRHESE